jgi:alanine dehydrogenase
VVACAARSRDESPVLRGEWLSPGTTVVSIGSTLPEQREVDVSVLRRADLIVADVPGEVAHDTGDMIAAAAAGVGVTGRLVSLSDLIAGRIPDWRGVGAAGVAVYKSVGSALQDVVVAGQLLATARQRGLGMPLPDTIKPVRK